MDLSNKKKWKTDIHKNIKESQNNEGVWKNSDTWGHAVWFYLYDIQKFTKLIYIDKK